MSWWEALLLIGGGAIAGVINAMAGGGSTLTVPLLVLAGVEGNDANGSNRLGILSSTVATAWSFHARGVKAYREAAPILLPVVIGSLVGSIGISRLADDTFETVFGLLMLPIIALSIRRPEPRAGAEPWSRSMTSTVFFAIGVYGGAIQAGVGLVMLAALTRAGYGLVKANAIKALVIVAVTMTALPVFIVNGQVRWWPGFILAVGIAAGGWVGARIAVTGGERVIRAFMVLAALVLAGRLVGLY